MMKRICAIVALVLMLCSIVCYAEHTAIDELSLEELLTLRAEINEAIMSITSEADDVLTPGDYYIGIDIPEGKAMLTYIDGNDKYASLWFNTIDNAGGEIVGHIAAGGDHPRVIATLTSGEMLTVQGASVLIKYLDD